MKNPSFIAAGKAMQRPMANMAQMPSTTPNSWAWMNFIRKRSELPILTYMCKKKRTASGTIEKPMMQNSMKKIIFATVSPRGPNAFSMGIPLDSRMCAVTEIRINSTNTERKIVRNIFVFIGLYLKTFFTAPGSLSRYISSTKLCIQ